MPQLLFGLCTRMAGCLRLKIGSEGAFFTVISPQLLWLSQPNPENANKHYVSISMVWWENDGGTVGDRAFGTFI